MFEQLRECPLCKSEVETESTITQEAIRCTLCRYQLITDFSFETIKAMHNYRPNEDTLKAELADRDAEIERLKKVISDAIENGANIENQDYVG